MWQNCNHSNKNRTKSGKIEQNVIFPKIHLEIRTKNFLHEQNAQKFNKASKTSFLRGYNTYTRKQAQMSFARFLLVIGKFCCGFAGFAKPSKTATKFLEF